MIIAPLCCTLFHSTFGYFHLCSTVPGIPAGPNNGRTETTQHDQYGYTTISITLRRLLITHDNKPTYNCYFPKTGQIFGRTIIIYCEYLKNHFFISFQLNDIFSQFSRNNGHSQLLCRLCHVAHLHVLLILQFSRRKLPIDFYDGIFVSPSTWRCRWSDSCFFLLLRFFVVVCWPFDCRPLARQFFILSFVW